MDIDPVSGNEIPPGVSAENVRDDIDAKLSDGEYVFSADVVKYFGLDKLESMAKKAKEGMLDMESQGRIKTVSVEPNLSEEVIQAATGGLIEDADLSVLVDKVRAEMTNNPNLSKSLGKMGVTFAEGGAVDFKPNDWAVPGSSYFDTVAVTYRIYVDANGNRVSIPFRGSEPQIAIPPGYSLEAQGAEVTKKKEVVEDPDFDNDSGAPEGLDYTTMEQEKLEGIVGRADKGLFGNEEGFLDKMFGMTGIGRIAGAVKAGHVKRAQDEIDRRNSDEPNPSGGSTPAPAPSPTKPSGISSGRGIPATAAPSRGYGGRGSEVENKPTMGRSAGPFNKGGFLIRTKDNKPTY